MHIIIIVEDNLSSRWRWLPAHISDAVWDGRATCLQSTAVGECDAKDRQQAKKQTAGTIHLYINYAKLYTDSILLSTRHSSTKNNNNNNNNNRSVA